ncbi:protein-L-histidine N-pros-methyltransferase-like [Saccostrea echinata]|uniref:protein-L-histidine N-pros-methyltransferase-like n=1 Tax=Saccostrea echinata TaxID=191078 RepID=UPI002A83BE54|nr:protein-L-histidine N-pros-methyltransferase-like [Saccostrea echinata]
MISCVLFILSLNVKLVHNYAWKARMNEVSHIRSPLVRAVYQRLKEDERQRNDDHHYWYSFDRARVSADVCECFIQFHQDAETEQFLSDCYEKADWIFTQLYHSIAKSILSWFMTSTSINGLLQRGSMFVFSDEQLRQLLQVGVGWEGQNMLDLGAGDGRVTEKMAKYFRQVYATEVSSTMVWRLQQKNYKILGLDEWDNGSISFDLISCLNLLDRCNKPMTILHSIRRVLTPGVGKAIVAVVLPFKPYVEQDSKDHSPEENLLIQGQSFEEQVQFFIKKVFEPAGFIVEKFSRLPYLCEGDLHQSFYALDDAVFVIKPNS